MALSKRSTTLAILRGILGPVYGQETRFAQLAARSVSWVKKVSAGLAPLSEEAALALEAAAGISAAWLLRDDTDAPPVSAAGERYDFAAFEQHRAQPMETAGIPPLSGVLPSIARISAAAARQGKASLFNYRLRHFLDECRAEFGEAASEPVASRPKTAWEPALDVQLL